MPRTCAISGEGLTVIILKTEEETQALLELLDLAPPDLAVVLDNLTNEMMNLEPLTICESSITAPWLRSAVHASDKELSTPSREAEQGAWLDN